MSLLAAALNIPSNFSMSASRTQYLVRRVRQNTQKRTVKRKPAFRSQRISASGTTVTTKESRRSRLARIGRSRDYTSGISGEMDVPAESKVLLIGSQSLSLLRECESMRGRLADVLAGLLNK